MALLGVSSWVGVGTAWAECALSSEPLARASWLRQRKEHFRAMGIYLDALHDAREAGQRVAILECMVQTYLEAGQPERAYETMAEMAEFLAATGPMPEAYRLNLVQVSLAGSQFFAAEQLLGSLAPRSQEGRRRHALFAGMSSVGQRRWSSARGAFTKLASECEDERSPVCSIARRNAVFLGRKPDRVSPAGAALLSAVLPGAGQVYTRHYFDALFYGGTVGLFGFLTADTVSWEDGWAGQRASTYLLGALTALLYTSNVISSWRNAQRLNDVRAYYYQQELLLGSSRVPLLPLSAPAAPPDAPAGERADEK